METPGISMAEAARRMTIAVRDVQRAMASLLPPIEGLAEALEKLRVDLYRARLRRWVGYAAAAFVVGIVVALLLT